jgi:antitoxin ChpS
MYKTNLRKVGGSVMLAVPPALLQVLKLEAGSSVGMAVKDGQLVVEPQVKPRQTLADLLAASNFTDPPHDEESKWVHAPNVGGELL